MITWSHLTRSTWIDAFTQLQPPFLDFGCAQALHLVSVHRLPAVQVLPCRQVLELPAVPTLAVRTTHRTPNPWSRGPQVVIVCSGPFHAWLDWEPTRGVTIAGRYAKAFGWRAARIPSSSTLCKPTSPPCRRIAVGGAAMCSTWIDSTSLHPLPCCSATCGKNCAKYSNTLWSMACAPLCLCVCVSVCVCECLSVREFVCFTRNAVHRVCHTSWPHHFSHTLLTWLDMPG